MDAALAGGVNTILAPELTIAFSQARMMAADGRCKTFDARADGFVRGERVREMYRRLHRGDLGCLGPLWMILATERWYSTMFPASRAA